LTSAIGHGAEDDAAGGEGAEAHGEVAQVVDGGVVVDLQRVGRDVEHAVEPERVEQRAGRQRLATIAR
jgi:hypothetical protein